METNLPQMLTDVGFPIGLCLILLYGFKKVGEVLLARVVDPVITSHREFLAKLEQVARTHAQRLEGSGRR